MHRSEVDLNAKTQRSLMRFLAQHMINSSHLARLLDRVYQDQSLPIQFDECAVLSKVIIAKYGLDSYFVPIPLSAAGRYYLKVLPSTVDKVGVVLSV